MAWMRLKVDDSYFTSMQQDLISRLDSARLRKNINEVVKELCEPYVPYKDGGLRENVAVGPKEIQYRSVYARYLYYGVVYKPNYFRGYGADGEKIFRTPKGTVKWPSTQMLEFGDGGAFWFETMLAQNGAELDNRILQCIIDESNRRSK